MGNKIADVIGSIIVLATVTTLVLPGRQTGTVLRAGGAALSTSINSALGNGPGSL